MKLRLKFMGVVIILISFMSCSENSLVNEISDIDNQQWAATDIKEISFDVKDTLSGYDFFLLVRNNEDYPFRNLYMFVNLEFPNDKIARDTVYCELANKEGKWLGKGVGSEHNSEILYKINQQFPLKGEYKIKLQHGMREDNLSGVSHVGISIRNNK